MDFYTYSMPGTNLDNLRTKEGFQTYVDCGFTVFHLTGKNSYCLNGDESWENSNAKKCFDYAKELGVKRIILRDQRLISLIGAKSIIGDECAFSSERDLDTYVRACMKDYAQEEGFYGLGLRDEPCYNHFTAYGQVYRSIKRVAKEFGYENLLLQVNLNPMLASSCGAWCENSEDVDEKTGYERYLDAFFQATGADVISVDNYPFKPRYIGGTFLQGYYLCFQILQNKCQEYNAKLAFVLQAFEMIHMTKPEATAGARRITSVNEMYLQMNSALGFGVQEISFFTYETPRNVAESGVYRSDQGSSLITDKGNPTRIYAFTKEVIAHAKRVETELCKRRWLGATISVHQDLSDIKDVYLRSEGKVKNNALTPPLAEFDNTHQFSLLKKYTYDRDILLLSEWKGTDAGYMYMACNVVDGIYKLSLAPMRIRLTFDGCKKALVYKYDKWQEIELQGGMYETTLVFGEGVFIIPQQE